MSIEKALEINNNIIIVGDLNDNLLSTRSSKLRETMILNNLTNVIIEPTRVTDLTATLLDPILISDSVTNLNSGILDVPSSISDHKCTFIFLKFQSDSSQSTKRRVWNYKRADFVLLNSLINNFDWSFLNNFNSC